MRLKQRIYKVFSQIKQHPHVSRGKIKLKYSDSSMLSHKSQLTRVSCSGYNVRQPVSAQCTVPPRRVSVGALL